MIRKIISGGQTGADTAALVIAKKLGIETGGTAPKGYRTEAGPNLRLRDEFGLTESDRADYRSRTKQNVRDADGTALFGNMGSPGSRLTIDLCRLLRSPYITNPSPEELVEWVEEYGIFVLNVAGNRASSHPFVTTLVQDTLREALAILDRR